MTPRKREWSVRYPWTIPLLACLAAGALLYLWALGQMAWWLLVAMTADQIICLAVGVGIVAWVRYACRLVPGEPDDPTRGGVR
jgi:membrane protein YdbS with pleckstrin-like domain